jgi:hypothetical protein
MFARFCGFGPGHKSTRNMTQVFRDDIKDAFGLADNLEVATKDVELEVSGDDGDGARLGDVEVDEEEDGEEDEDLDSVDGEDKDEGEDDGDLDGLVDGLGYDVL